MEIGKSKINPDDYEGLINDLVEQRDTAVKLAVKAAKELRIMLFTKPDDISFAVDLIIEIEKAYINHPFKE